MKPATIYDVARQAGVSHQTVSRYLSGFEGIRPATRERVKTALHELHYQQNTVARALRLRQSNRIGVLADRIDQHGPARVLSGATAAAQDRGYVLDVMSVDGLDAASVQTAVDMFRSNQVAGILAAAQTDVVRALFAERVGGVPMLAPSSSLLTADDIPSNEFAGSVAASHLLELGHRRIGYLSGPHAWIAARGRRDGFVQRVQVGGGEIVWEDAGDWSAQSGFDAWGRAQRQGSPMTAVAAANDSMAIGVISAASGEGLRVPADLSVIGTDDIPEARFLVPPLSTVALDFEGEGAAFIASLLGLLADEEPEASSINAPRLLVRSTTGAV